MKAGGYAGLNDRADIYIPFIERSLSVLSDGGSLGFTCVDRWMKNRYGGPLRSLVAERFHLKVYVECGGYTGFSLGCDRLSGHHHHQP